MNNNISVYESYLIDNEKKYVNQCLDSNWISSKGEFISKFERKLLTSWDTTNNGYIIGFISLIENNSNSNRC
tara:strand:+ start:281 stop:496 length:216 start_codon:yes stop_codon:yes gene_type:complete